MAKRGNGEGSVHQRKDGRWAASIDMGYRQGKRHRKHFLGWTRAEVVSKLDEAMAKHKKGINIDPERISVGDYLTRWLEESAKPTIRPATYRSYEGLIRTHIVPAFGKTLLQKLSPLQVQTLLNDTLARKKSARTAAYLLVLLRRALGQALRWNFTATSRNWSTVRA